MASKEMRQLLQKGEILGCEPLGWGSNHSFVVGIHTGNGEAPLLTIYKPQAGERALWDFPRGTLYKREYASYLLCEALGWEFIPPTVIRKGPHGIGSFQLYIHPDPEVDYSTLKEKQAEELRKICLFDIVANNADRKAGHYFQGLEGRVWGIDHGLTFHPSPKLRTVIWDFLDEPVPSDLLEDMKNFLEGFQGGNGFIQWFKPLLAKEEIRALLDRIKHILTTCRYPHPDPEGWNVPWPFY